VQRLACRVDSSLRPPQRLARSSHAPQPFRWLSVLSVSLFALAGASTAQAHFNAGGAVYTETNDAAGNAVQKLAAAS
jgi:hypothetical protein